MATMRKRPAETTSRVGVVLFNLGGPDSPDAIRPFLYNLFSDPAIIRLPGPLRRLVARMIARRRTPIAAEIYRRMGGGSPIRKETEVQVRALEARLKARGINARCVMAMRYWHPFSYVAASELKGAGVREVVLLPLYPQYSTTTTQSSLDDWRRTAEGLNLRVPMRHVCCYPTQNSFIAAHVQCIRDSLNRVGLGLHEVRLVFSAHGLPQRVIDKGDPYVVQVEATVRAVLLALGDDAADARICYQSRVGPLKWIGPSTEHEIRDAGRDGKNIVIVPIAFVSEHSETLVELDIEYKALAEQAGVPHYIRVPTLGASAAFIEGLADAVVASLAGERTDGWRCPAGKICAIEGGREPSGEDRGNG